MELIIFYFNSSLFCIIVLEESLGGNLPPRNGLREIPLRDVIPQADHLNKLLHLRKVVRKLQNMYIACKGVIDPDEWEDWGEKTMEHLRSNKTKGRSKVADRLIEHNGVHYYKKCKGKEMGGGKREMEKKK